MQVSLMSWEVAAGAVAERATLKDLSITLEFIAHANRSRYTLTQYGHSLPGGDCRFPETGEFTADNWSYVGGALLTSLYTGDEGALPGLKGWTIHSGSARLASKDIDVTHTDEYSTTRLRASLVLVHQPAEQ